MNKLYLALVAVCILPYSVTAQRMLGVATGNWNPTGSLYLNPALIADSRSRLTIDILSVNGYVDNDMGTISKNKLADQLTKGKAPGLNNILDFDNKGSGSVTGPYAELRGPGVMWNKDHKNSFVVTTRVRGSSQFTGIDQELYRSVSDVDYAKNGGMSYVRNNTGYHWNNGAWGEIGFTWSRVLIDKGINFLSAGATLRYLGGISYSSFLGSGINASYNAAKDSLGLTNVNMTYSSNIPDEEHTANTRTPVPQLLGRFLGIKGGHGMSGDLGIAYEYRPHAEKYTFDMDGKTGIVDHTQSRYKLRLSAALTDVGGIYYGTANNKKVTASGKGSIIGNRLSKNVFNFKDFTRYTRGRGFTLDTVKSSTVYHMPAALVLGADYRLGKSVFVNATWMNNLADRNATGTYIYNQLSVTPRYESRSFSIGLPVTYSMQSRSVKMGFGVCLAGFFIGSDDLLAVASENQYGFNVYMGGFIPFNYKRPADRDGDKVSDKKDVCPDVAGLWAFQGCPDPDKDKDGIPDAQDRCPSVFGTRAALGCPDKDGDGVADATDRCPDKAGTAALKGCPDTDGDGIADIDDACPDVKGLATLKGCPEKDTDGDGVPDNIDKCPTVAGAPAAQGCPEPRGPEPKTTLPSLAFETGKAVIKKSSYPRLNETVKTLNDNKDYSLLIQGYTDNVGSDAANLLLSKSRAASVKAYFTNNGVAANRLETAGMGNANPVGDNSTAAGRAMNRRVELILKKK